MERIVIAYSGGPGSSVAIPWLREKHHAEIVAVIVDLGQHEWLDGIRQRALASGAVRAHVLDRRDMFVRDYLLPVVQAGAMTPEYPALASALGRPLIAKALVEIAHIEGARAVAHAAAEPADRERIAAAVHALDAQLPVMDAATDWDFGALGMAGYARQRGIPFAMDDAPALVRMVPVDTPVYVSIDFREGVPVRINGVEMDLVELFASLDTIAAAQGAGGAAALAAAQQALQQQVLPADLAERMPGMRAKYAGLVDTGHWFTPEREAMTAMMGTLQAQVTGAARVKVVNGTCEVVSHVN